MASYRAKHVQPQTIGMIPRNGYVNETRFSPDSIRWLDFVAYKQGLRIQHALNNTGERKIAGVSVDGYCEETKTVFQYHVSIHLLIAYIFHLYITDMDFFRFFFVVFF